MLRNAPGRHAGVMRLPDLLHTRRTAAVQQGQCVSTYLYGMPAWRRIKHDIFGWPTANQWGVQTRHRGACLNYRNVEVIGKLERSLLFIANLVSLNLVGQRLTRRYAELETTHKALKGSRGNGWKLTEILMFFERRTIISSVVRFCREKNEKSVICINGWGQS